MRDGDTIVALSSGALPSGVAVIRISGPAVPEIVISTLGSLPAPRKMVLGRIGTREALDQGLVVYFPAPQSFTGEHCAEFHVHGSPAGVRAILRDLTQSPGTRLAEAGEFTRRAFENGKLDLTAIEGLGDLLASETENQRRQALARYDGGLSAKVDVWRNDLLDLRAEIEARLDFSDEGDVADNLPQGLVGTFDRLASELEQMAEATERGRIQREGLRVALAGAPNVGKSSLLNALAKSEIAIVTDEPGTTRDVKEVAIDIDGHLVIIVDLAGLRDTASKAEAEGVRRAGEQLHMADLVLWLEAPDVEPIVQPALDVPHWTVRTKSDIGGADPKHLAVSTHTGEGLNTLIDKLGDFAKTAGSGEPVLVSRERDRDALGTAALAVRSAKSNLDTLELSADHLRRASQTLERLVGRLDPELVLDRLFSSFCIGK